MTVELVLQSIAIIAAIAAGVGFIYKKGIKSGVDQQCIESIESDIAEIKKDLGDHEDESGKNKKTLHKRIDETNEKIVKVGNDVSYIRGKIDAVLADK